MVAINFKSVIEKLSVFRHNLSLLVPIIITVVALVLFIPTRLISSKLRGQIEQESIGKIKRLKSIEPVSSDRWKQEEKYQQAYEKDANQIKQLVLQSTERDLLSYKIFPEPKTASVLVFEEFGRRYREGVTEMIASLDAINSPTDAEIQQSLQQMTTRSSRMEGRLRLPTTTQSSSRVPSYSAYGGRMRRSEAEQKIVDEICRNRAKLGRIYANASDLAGYGFWGEYKYDVDTEKATEDCWYWQLGYWIIEDVVDTIEKLNSGSDSVFESPVKQLMGVKFTLGQTTMRTFRPSRRGSVKKKDSGEKPTYVVELEDGLTVPCTERVCNDVFDVVHFDVTVLVDSEAVLPFMEELCSAKEHTFRGYLEQEPVKEYKHNQITILESNVTLIDRQDPLHNLYRYGEDAVVELDLICEYIFIKSAYEQVKPESVKKTIEGEEEE